MADHPLHKATHEQMRQWPVALVAIEQELHSAGMHATARAVNRAVRVIGWEFAGNFEKVAEAARSDTP
jgi:hypothetical protein